jgi:hypothetical protein
MACMCTISSSRTIRPPTAPDLELASWLGSHPAAVALQATLGASASLGLAYLSYELYEKQLLHLKRNRPVRTVLQSGFGWGW